MEDTVDEGEGGEDGGETECEEKMKWMGNCRAEREEEDGGKKDE